MIDTLAFILAGGRGRRLALLTHRRTKPAVRFGGCYRIIDFTLSNCVNSGVRWAIVLAQYRSFSLTRHLLDGWNLFSPELGEHIYAVMPQQTGEESWYRGRPMPSIKIWMLSPVRHQLLRARRKAGVQIIETAATLQGRRGIGWAVVMMAVLMLMSSAPTAIGGSTGEVVDDPIITTKVKTSFVADPTVSALSIEVETSQGVANPPGIVNSEQERQRLIQLAQDVEGVKRVEARNLFVKH